MQAFLLGLRDKLEPIDEVRNSNCGWSSSHNGVRNAPIIVFRNVEVMPEARTVFVTNCNGQGSTRAQEYNTENLE